MKKSYLDMKLKLEKMERNYGQKSDEELDAAYARMQVVRAHEGHVKNKTQLPELAYVVGAADSWSHCLWKHGIIARTKAKWSVNKVEAASYRMK